MNTCMHSIIFCRPLFHLRSKLGGVCPYRSTISPRSFSILAVVLGGCLGERVEGGFVAGQEGRPVERSPFRWLWVMMVFAEIYQFLDFGGLVRAPTRFFSYACPPCWMYLRTILVRMPAATTPPAAQLISRDQRVAPRTSGHSSRWRSSGRAFVFGLHGSPSLHDAIGIQHLTIYMIPQSRTQSSILFIVYTRILCSR